MKKCVLSSFLKEEIFLATRRCACSKFQRKRSETEKARVTEFISDTWYFELPHPRVKVSIVGSLRDREVACSASDRQGSNFESCVWRTVSSQSSHHPQEVLLAQFSLYVHKGGLKPDSFHFYFELICVVWSQIFYGVCRTKKAR